MYEFTGTCNANSETSSLWYTFTVSEAGNISFILSPVNNADDYDWGMFNITNGGCAGINAQNGTSPEVGCNSYGSFGANGPTGISTAAGGTGVSNGPGDINGPAFNADLPVQAGQTYALVVMNWSNSLNGYTIDFSQSTASIFDSTVPTISEAVMDCSNANLPLEFSEPMISSTVEPSDFMITTSGGGVIPFVSVTPDLPNSISQTGFTISLAEPLPGPASYILNITSTSGNVEDVCGNIVVETTMSIEVGEPLRYVIDVTPACNGTNGSVHVQHLSGGVLPVDFALGGTPMPNGHATGLNDGIRSLTLSDGNGCVVSEAIEIPNHLLTITAQQEQDSLSCAMPEVVIDGIALLPAQSVQYAWSVITENGLGPIFSSNASPTVSEPGNYFVIVTHAASGCTDSASVEIFTTTTPTLDLGEIQLPNIVTPNSDGRNDVWRPYALNDPERDITSVFDTYELTIFNRWGQVVHDSGISRSWNARNADAGTYFYEITYRAECGTVIDGKGTGTITVLQ